MDSERWTHILTFLLFFYIIIFVIFSFDVYTYIYIFPLYITGVHKERIFFPRHLPFCCASVFAAAAHITGFDYLFTSPFPRTNWHFISDWMNALCTHAATTSELMFILRFSSCRFTKSEMTTAPRVFEEKNIIVFWHVIYNCVLIFCKTREFF